MTRPLMGPGTFGPLYLATDQKAVRTRGPGRVVLGSKPQLATTEKLVSWAERVPGETRFSLRSKQFVGVEAAAAPLGDLVGGQWAAQEVALGQVAAEATEHVQRALVLDALGDRCQAQVVAQVDGRAHDGVLALLSCHVGNERSIVLELVGGQPFEITER